MYVYHPKKSTRHVHVLYSLPRIALELYKIFLRALLETWVSLATIFSH